jgi:small GTP-binding protein
MDSAIKVVLLGATGVGKTSLVNRFMTGLYADQILSTIGAASSRASVSTSHGPVTLDIWDTAGQERYRSLAPIYYQGSDVAMIVFACSDSDSVTEAIEWAAELKHALQFLPLLYLVANKIDVEARLVSPEDGEATADKIGARYFEASAKTGTGVTQIFTDVAESAVRKPQNGVTDPPVPPESRAKRTCSC